MTAKAQLQAISPIDGRYRTKTDPLALYFSEMALIKYRILVEIEYFISLNVLNLPNFEKLDADKINTLRNIYRQFTLEDASAIKKIERTTNHDVKAVEYFIKQKLKDLGMLAEIEFVHFGLTSQDINNTAVPMSLKHAIESQYLPLLKKIITTLQSLANDWRQVSMLARTHGQPASPTKLGKEIMVFVERLNNQLQMLEQVPFVAKFGGATGNFNAHSVAYPAISWPQFADRFVSESLGMKRLQFTTQIEHYDMMAALFDNMKRVNVILVDFCRDIWTYISQDYFKQKIKAGEIGSSAMPHKVNPIDFENAEGNLGMANALLVHLSGKLPISRLQRDLTDSTVTRNIGVPIGHCLISFHSIIKGLSKLVLNETKIKSDLEDNWAVVAEAFQTILRREGVENAYEQLLQLTRTGSKIDASKFQEFIQKSDLKEETKSELRSISPENYTGIDHEY